MSVPSVGGPSYIPQKQPLDWNNFSTLLENLNNIISDNMAITDEGQKNFQNFTNIYQDHKWEFTPQQQNSINPFIETFNSLPANQPLNARQLIQIQAGIARIEKECNL